MTENREPLTVGDLASMNNRDLLVGIKAIYNCAAAYVHAGILEQEIPRRPLVPISETVKLLQAAATVLTTPGKELSPELKLLKTPAHELYVLFQDPVTEPGQSDKATWDEMKDRACDTLRSTYNSACKRLCDDDARDAIECVIVRSKKTDEAGGSLHADVAVDPSILLPILDKLAYAARDPNTKRWMASDPSVSNIRPSSVGKALKLLAKDKGLTKGLASAESNSWEVAFGSVAETQLETVALESSNIVSHEVEPI